MAFDEPAATSGGGALLLKSFDGALGVTAGMHDTRFPGMVRHALLELVRQRVFGIACGYVDGNDAGRMASDPLQGELCGARAGLVLQPTLSRRERGVSRTVVALASRSARQRGADDLLG